jgi:hypothetical protein
MLISVDSTWVDSIWDAFVQPVEENNGIWGGCWCLGFYVKLKGRTAAQHRTDIIALPDWRIRCFFTGIGRHRRGVTDGRLRESRLHAHAVNWDNLGWCWQVKPLTFRFCSRRVLRLTL